MHSEHTRRAASKSVSPMTPPDRAPRRLRAALCLAAAALCPMLMEPNEANAQGKSPPTRSADIPFDKSALGALALWDDGLSEMLYYDAVETIYGKPRAYTRVHLTNREFFDPTLGVKAETPNAPDAVPVLKMNIAEEIPTENYNYRWLTTLFIHRHALTPLKAVFANQEWCGVTYKHARWTAAGATLRQFSYFENEGESQHDLSANTWPFETGFLLVREFVAGGTIPEIAGMLPPLRSNRATPPRVESSVSLTALGRERVTTPAGVFETERVQLNLGKRDRYIFWVESAPPWRVVKFDFGEERGALRASERRAYWDRSKPSAHHEAGEAP